MTHRKKLIEVALPLEAINKASAREKSIRHEQPFQREHHFAVTGMTYDLVCSTLRASAPN